MVFTTVATHATGDVFPATDWNTYVRDNFAYLHGDAGQFTVLDGMIVSHATRDPYGYLVTGDANQRWRIEAATGRTLMGPGGATALDTYAAARVAAGVPGGGSLTNIKAYHRHPYTVLHHIESGVVGIGALANAAFATGSVTYTAAGATGSNPIAGLLDPGSHFGLQADAGSRSASGFTIAAGNLAGGATSTNVDWIADVW